MGQHQDLELGLLGPRTHAPNLYMKKQTSIILLLLKKNQSKFWGEGLGMGLGREAGPKLWKGD